MRAYDTSYFCDKGKGPLVDLSPLYDYDREEIVIHINHEGSYTAKPSITLHLCDEQDLINFKNSVLEAYESYERGKRREVA
jgi:hypothetical protein